MNILFGQKSLATACLVSATLLPIPALAQDNAQLCANQHGLEAEYSDRVGDLKLTNNSDDYIDVRRVDPDGTSMEMLSLEAGVTTTLTQNRKAVYVGLDSNGNCMGAGKLRESKGNIVFGN